MTKKLKLALAALLGFSAACSSVKNAPVRGESGQKQQTGLLEMGDSARIRPRIIVMYGVRSPGQAMPGVGVQIPDAKGQSPASNQLDPVLERPVDDTPTNKNESSVGRPVGQ